LNQLFVVDEQSLFKSNNRPPEFDIVAALVSAVSQNQTAVVSAARLVQCTRALSHCFNWAITILNVNTINS